MKADIETDSGSFLSKQTEEAEAVLAGDSSSSNISCLTQLLQSRAQKTRVSKDPSTEQFQAFPAAFNATQELSNSKHCSGKGADTGLVT